MNTIEAVEDRRKESGIEKMIRIIKDAIRELDNTNDLFNDHPIIGFENRSVND